MHIVKYISCTTHNVLQYLMYDCEYAGKQKYYIDTSIRGFGFIGEQIPASITFSTTARDETNRPPKIHTPTALSKMDGPLRLFQQRYNP